MIVENRKGDWVLRIYSKNPDGSWVVGTEQYFPTRALMRKHKSLWTKVLGSAKFKTKTYKVSREFYSETTQELVIGYKEVR